MQNALVKTFFAFFIALAPLCGEEQAIGSAGKPAATVAQTKVPRTFAAINARFAPLDDYLQIISASPVPNEKTQGTDYLLSLQGKSSQIDVLLAAQGLKKNGAVVSTDAQGKTKITPSQGSSGTVPIAPVMAILGITLPQGDPFDTIRQSVLQVSSIDLDITANLQLRCNGSIVSPSSSIPFSLLILPQEKQFAFAINLSQSGSFSINNTMPQLTALNAQLSITPLSVVISTMAVQDPWLLAAAGFTANQKIKPLATGSTLMWKVQSKPDTAAGSLLADFGIPQALMLFNAPASINLKNLTSADFKKLIFTILPIAEPVNGLCPAGGLAPLLTKMGLQQLSSTAAKSLGTICFERPDIILNFEKGLDKPIFVLGGALKSGGKAAEIKADASQRGLALGWESSVEKNITLSSLHPALASYDKYFALNDVVLGFTNKIGTSIFDTHDGLIDPKTPGALLIRKGMTIIGTLAGATQPVQNALRLLHVEKPRLAIWIPANMKSPKDIKLKLISRQQSTTTVTVGALVQELGLTMPSGAFFNQLAQTGFTLFDIGLADTETDNPKVRALLNLMIGQTRFQLYVLVSLKDKKQATVAIKPQGISSFTLGSLNQKLSIIDQQVRLIDNTIVISAVESDDAALLKFAATTPEDIKIIKRHTETILPQPKPQETEQPTAPTEEPTETADDADLAALLGEDPDTETKGAAPETAASEGDTGDANTQESEEDDAELAALLGEEADTTPTAAPAESGAPAASGPRTITVEEITTLKAHKAAAVKKINPGVTVISDFTAVANSLFANSLQDIGIQSARTILYVPKDLDLKKITTKEELKRIALSIIPLQKPAEGLCLLGALDKPLRAGGADSAADQIKEITQPFCFGTEIVIDIAESEIDIGGPLKSGGDKAQINFNFGEGKKITAAWEGDAPSLTGVQPSGNAAASQSASIALQALAVVHEVGTFKKTGVIVSTQDTAMVYDLHDGMKDPETPGSLKVTKGITLYGDLDLSKGRHQNVMTLLGTSMVHYKAHMPLAPKGIRDVSFELVAADNKPMTLCINKLLQQAGITVPTIPLLSGALNDCARIQSLTFGYDSQNRLVFTINAQTVIAGANVLIQTTIPFDQQDEIVVAMSSAAPLQLPAQQLPGPLNDVINQFTLQNGVLYIALKDTNNQDALQNGLKAAGITAPAPITVKQLTQGYTFVADAIPTNKLNDFAKQLLVNKVRVIAQTPFTTASINDLRIQFATAAAPTADKQQQLCLGNLLKEVLAQIPDNPLTQALKTTCMNVQNAVVQFINGNFEIDYQGSMTIGGTAGQVTVHTRIVGNDTEYTVTAKVPQGLAMKTIDPSLSSIDDALKLSNVAIKVSNSKEETSAVSIEGEAESRAFLSAIAQEQLKIPGFKFVYQLKRGAQSWRDDATIRLTPLNQSDSQFCTAAPVSLVTEHLKMQAAELLQKLFVTVCFKNPVFGLSLDQKNLDFFIYGPATAGAMNGDAIIQVGQGIEETEYRFTMGLRHIDELRFADIDPSLAAIDEQLTLSNVRMALTNVKDASVFTEKQGAEAASAGHAIVHLEPGITIVSSVKLKGDVGAISGFVNIKKLRCTIFIPKGAKSSKDIQVRIEEEETADKAETICLDGVLAPIPGYTPLSKLLGVSKLCVTKKSLVIIPATDGLILTILGSIDTGGTSADATIVVNTKKSESSIALVINGHKNFDLTKISSNLAPLVAITAVKDPVFMLSTGKTGIDLPGIGSIEPGLTVKGICHFGSFYGTILDAFSANDLLVTVTIPSDPANLNGYIFKATKQIDRTVSSLKLQYINLILRGGTPPELELDIDADLTLPGNNQIYRTKLSASIKDIGWTLNGALACSPTGCPTFAVPLGIPIKLAATPEVPLSVLLNFAGGVTEGFGGSGLLTVNNKSLLTAFDIKAAHPDQNAVMVKSDPAKKDKWYPSDLMALFSIFTQQLPFKTLGLADFFYLTNLGLSAAKTETEISGFTVPKGLDVSGKLVIDPLGLQGQLKLHVKTPDLVSVLTAADSIGVIGEGSVSAIDLGPAFKMTSTDGKTGPTISVALTKNKQEFVLDGQISVLNGLLNNHGQVTFTPAGMNAQLDGSVAGLAGKFQLNAAVQDFINKDFDHIGFTGTISQDFTSTVNDALAASMKDILSGVGTASAQLTAICQKMAGLMSVVNIDCRQCLASLAAPLTVSDAVIQAALKAANITINKIELDSTLGNMIRGQSAQLFITLTVFGRSLKVGPIGIDVHKPAGPLTAAIGAALKAVLTPADIIKSLSQSIVAAIPTQAICNAGITLGASKLQGQVTIDTAHPNKSSISATFNQLSLADLMSLASKGLNIAIPANAVPPLGITNGTLAMSAQSASVNGSLSVLGLGAGTVHGSIDGTGCSLSGALTGLSIPHVLSFADGAALTLVLNDKQQQISVAGGLTLFDLLSGKGTITISATPTISLDTSFLGIGAQATITGFTADHFDPSAANLKIVLTNDLSTAVADALKNLISPYQNTSSQIAGNASSVVGQIADTCNQIPVAANIVCSPINDARDLLSKINAINNQLANMVNQIAQQCTIKSLEFDGQLNAFKVQSGKLVIPTINAVITLMGRDVNLTLHNVAPSSVGDLVQAIAQAAFASMGPDQMVQQIQNQLKQLNHLLDNAAKLLADALKNALLNLGKMLGDEAQKIGEQAAGVAVEAGKQAAQAAQEAAQKAEEAAKQAAKAAQEAAKAAEQAAEDAAKAAEQAAQQAMQAAKAAVEAAKKAAEDAARAAEKAAEDAARAIANAGRSIGHALHKF